MKRRIAVTIGIAGVAAVLVASFVVAHEGHGKPVMGTVTTVDETSLTLTTTDGESAVFHLTAETVIKRGATEVDAESIGKGERAVVRYEAHGDAKEAHEVILAPADASTAAATFAASTPGLVEVEHHFVCMVNDAVFPQEQIPVEVEGKTYYGCCPMCEEILGRDAAMRTAVDPVSGNEVDKATAIIRARPDRSVLYFESEETLAQYEARSR